MTVKTVISDSNFAKIQKMAKLTLDSDEVSRIHPQLDEALRAIEVFDELNLADVTPLAHPGGLVNVTRADEITPSFTQEQALQNAPFTHEGYVMVPGVFEEQDS